MSIDWTMSSTYYSVRDPCCSQLATERVSRFRAERARSCRTCIWDVQQVAGRAVGWEVVCGCVEVR